MKLKLISHSILIIFFSLCSVNHLFAQPDAVYRIKLVTVSNQSDLSIFKKLNDIGVVVYEPYMNDKFRVYLGNYLGKATAEKILPVVVQKGFIGAFIEKINSVFTNESGDSLTHTLQFIALKKLDIRTIINNPKLSEADKKEVYIWYHNGFYRVSIGMINENQTEKTAQYKAKTLDIGFTAFSQKFAGVAPVAEAPKQVPTKIKIPNAVKPVEKDKFEIELKKSSTTTTKTAPNKVVDPILVPKEAKINPNAKLKPIK